VTLRSDDVHEDERNQHSLEHRDEVDDEPGRTVDDRHHRQIWNVEQYQQSAEEHHARQDDLKRRSPEPLGKQKEDNEQGEHRNQVKHPQHNFEAIRLKSDDRDD